MANGWFDSGKEDVLNGDLDWVADDVRVVLVNTSAWTVDLTSDANLSDVPGGSRVATSGALAGKTVVDGVADADDIVVASVTGSQVQALVVYKHTGVESTSTLLAYIDTGVGNVPFTPTGSDITLRWNSGGIFTV